MKRLLEGRAECGENSAMASRFSPSNGFSLPFLLLLLIVLQLSTPRRGERAPWEQRDLVSHRQKKQIHMQPLSDEKKAKIPRCGFASSFGVFGALFGLLFPSSWWWRVLVLFARDGDKGQKEGARGVEGGGNSKRQGQRASERPRLRALRRRVWSRSFFFFFFPPPQSISLVSLSPHFTSKLARLLAPAPSPGAFLVIVSRKSLLSSSGKRQPRTEREKETGRRKVLKGRRRFFPHHLHASASRTLPSSLLPRARALLRTLLLLLRQHETKVVDALLTRN